MSYVNLEEVSECPFTSEDVLCSVMSKSNRRDQGRIQTSRILVLWSHPETPPSPETACEQSSRNSKHSAGAHTQEVPHSAVSRATVKSKLVPNLSTSGAYCYTDEICTGKYQFNITFAHFSAVFLDFEAREVTLLLCSV